MSTYLTSEQQENEVNKGFRVAAARGPRPLQGVWVECPAIPDEWSE